ncbi:hypothetical protein B0H19DRAFT_1134162 [Mycena capillaripes]|nr:hypothetical protein B0H19DRAFT_1134162 [Mycena capillaripes]
MSTRWWTRTSTFTFWWRGTWGKTKATRVGTSTKSSPHRPQVPRAPRPAQSIKGRPLIKIVMWAPLTAGVSLVAASCSTRFQERLRLRQLPQCSITRPPLSPSAPSQVISPRRRKSLA